MTHSAFVLGFLIGGFETIPLFQEQSITVSSHDLETLDPPKVVITLLQNERGDPFTTQEKITGRITAMTNGASPALMDRMMRAMVDFLSRHQRHDLTIDGQKGHMRLLCHEPSQMIHPDQTSRQGCIPFQAVLSV